MEGVSNPCAGTPVFAIIGAGFSGTMVAVHLARMTAPGQVRILLFEKADRFARGIAYGTHCDEHLLNVPAGMMSALPDEPGHFFQWLHERDPKATEGTFAPRKRYGEYLGDLLQTAPQVERISDEVESVRPLDGGRLEIATRAGRSIATDRMILALGHMPPQDLPVMDGCKDHEAYVAHPWSAGALKGLGHRESLVLIGTGLTAVDLIVEARHRGHEGSIVAVSRHGLLPCRHQSAVPRPHFAVGGPKPTARTLLKTIRAESVLCRGEGGDWRSVVDSVRPVAQTVWRDLGVGERSRFLRHLAPRWDVHRHRLAPQIDDILVEARRQGSLEVIAGRIMSQKPQGRSLEIAIRRRGESTMQTLLADRVINCTGPSSLVASRRSPLLQSLLNQGIARSGPLALGLEVADNGALQGALPGEDRVFALGPLLKEKLWETTAVRELRVQARDLARELLRSSGVAC